MLTMVTSLIPSTLVTTAFAAENPSAQASGQAGKTTVKFDNKWPDDMNADITDVLITGTTIPGPTLTVEKGKTLIIHGSGTLSGSGRAQHTPFFIVEKGGHLVLDNVTITANAAAQGTVVVKKGGLLDLGYNDQKDRHAPGITGNTTSANLLTSTAKNLVVYDGATVRLNAAAEKKIGVTGVYADGSAFIGTPISVMEGGRYSIKGDDSSQENLETNIEADDVTFKLHGSSLPGVQGPQESKMTLRYFNDHLIYVESAINILVWDPIRYFNNVEHAFTHYDGAIFQTAYRLSGYGDHYISGTPSKPLHLTDAWLAALEEYDMIVLNYPAFELNEKEIAALNKFLSNGGRVFLQFENPAGIASRKTMITNGQKVANSLNAEFSIDDTQWVDANTQVEVNTASELVDKIQSHECGKAAYIFSDSDSVTWLFQGTTTKKQTSYIVCDQNAGNKNGEKWGSLTICGDGYYFDYKRSSEAMAIGKQLLDNLLKDSRKNRLIAATGVNPNKKIDPQATTTTTVTPYLTPYAALQKATETNTVTLLTHSNAALTPTRDELLFENAKLAYEADSRYAGSTIYADTAGVYLDITKTGEVNLRSGTVTVTPKDKNYVLTMNGTMDDTGSTITGGYKITATGPYTLDADDEKTPILAENGGGAKLTIPKAGTAVTVAYSGGADGKLNGKTVTYTAKNDGDSFYLGCYTVTYNVDGTVTWTADDLAWDGHDFVTKMTPAEGYEAKGEKLAVVDQTSHDLGNYQMENGTKENDPDTGKTDTWGVFNSVKKLADGVTPKITIRQQYLHNNNVDRNGYSTVTVRDVRANIIIKTTGDAVQSARPNIYVVGVGKRAGYEDEQLWAYTTQRTTDDQNLTKDVEGWPWANWKAVSAKTAQGTQAKYEDKVSPIVNWTTQQIKDSSTAGGKLCPVELTKGDMVVVFEYEWDMVDVKINAKLGSSADPDSAVDFPGYIPQYAELQRDVKGTIYAPNLSGYQPDQTSQEFTPTPVNGQYGPYEVTFYYTMAMGQVVYRAVDEADHELATWDGPRVMQGDAVSTDWKLAPDLAGYQVKQSNGTALDVDGQPATKYDGKQITVTWVYESKTRDVEIKMVEYTADGDHRGAELRTDTTSYAKSPVGFTLNLTAPAIPGYTVKGIENDNEVCASKSVFVDDTATGKITVYFYYEVNTQDDAKITVQMWDKVNNEEIWSYTVPGQNGEKQLVRVPAVKGYVSDPSNKDTSIAPDQTLNADWGKGTVRFLYSPNTVKVTVKLVDSTKTATDADYELNSKLTNYKGSYTVVKGESIDIVAPDVYGYTLADGQDSVHKLTVDPNESKTELTYTIKYIPANDGQVFVHVKGLDKDGNLCYEYNNSVTQGTASTKVTAFAVNGQKLTGATVGADNKFADVVDGELTVNTATANKGDQIEVVFTYGDNTANVTINAYYKDTTKTVEGFTPFKVKAEIGKPYSYGTLSLTGYDNVPGDAPSITKVAENGNELNYYFTKTNGNVVYQLVEDGHADHILATKSKTVAKGATIDAAAANAPTATNWKLKDTSEGTVKGATTDGKYDGVTSVTVTYVAVPKTKTVTIYQMDVDTDEKIGTKTVELETGKLRTLQKVNYLPENGKYTISGLKMVEIYVEDDDQARSVNMYFRRSADEDVTVNLVYTDEQHQKHTIQTYLVQRKPGTTITVKAPDMAYKGYTAKKNSVDVQPTQNSVEIEYTVTYYDIEIELLDEHDQPLTIPTGYKTNRKVRKGEGIVLTAPSIADYTLASTLVVSKTADELADADNRTITFRYKNTASANYVTHTIKLMDASKTPATLITQYNSVVTKGNGTTTYLAPLQDGYQVDKKSLEISNAASQDVVFNYTKSAATVTIHFVNDKGQPLTADGKAVADQILTGYEKGQEIMVPAPALDHFALAGEWKDGRLNTMTGVNATLTLSKTAANNEITFAYADRSDVTFVLKDDKDNDIQVINGVADEAYSVAENGKLNLTASGWKFKADHPDNSTEFNTETASVTVLTGTKKEYILHYTRITRDVTYKYWDVTNGENHKTKIDFTSNDNPTPVNVGENFTAAAPQIAGYTANALRVVTFVMYDANSANVEVNFNYIRKATGSVTVEHIVKNGGEEKVITSYTASGSVGEWFTATALTTDGNGITTDRKYKFTESATNQKTQTVKVGADAQTIKFVYEPNYVTVKTYTSVAGTKTEYQTGIEVVKTEGNQKLYAPSMTGYVLKGIEVTKGSTKDGAANYFPATGWQDNTLTLTGLNENVEVVYYYEKINDNIKEYQATVNVTDKYESYTLGTWEKTVTKDVDSKLTPKAHDGYTLTGYQIGDATEETVAKDQAANFVLTHKFTADTNVTFIYARTDGSAVVPGKDGDFGTKDDVVIKPNGDQLPKVNDDKTVSVPEGGEVVTPNGTVIPPNGSIVKPDGTIVAPGDNGKTDPGVTIDPSKPEEIPAAQYVYVKYLANGGKGEVATRIVKKGTEIAIANNTLTRENWTAAGWNTQENGAGTDYADGKTLTLNESLTLYAKWSKDAYKNKVTITFNSNTGDNSQTKTQVIGSDTSTAFGGKLNANTFALDGWTFRGWNTAKNGSGTAYTNEQEVTFTSASGATLNLYAQWYRFNADGSITIPGGDSTPNTNKDVTIHPNGNNKPSIDDKGNVKVPNGAEVTTPNGTIIPPNGSTVKPDGTIVTPDNTEITDPTNPPAGYITLTYKYGRTDKQVADVVQYGKDTITVMTGNPFDAPSGYQFDGWKVEGSNDKFTGTTVNATTTLVAQWKFSGSVVLAPDKTTEAGKRLEEGAKSGELKLVMRGEWAQDKTLTLGALVDGKQSTNEVYWRVDADSYKNEFGFTNSVLSGDQIVSVDANTGKLTVLNSGIVRIWCISKLDPDTKFSVVVVVPGDVNKDGRVNLNDVDMLCDLADKLSSITAEDPDDMTTWYLKELADMDCNGEFNGNDADALCDLADKLSKI